MKHKRRDNAAAYGFDLLMLGIESQRVVALRLARLAKGGKSAQREGTRMLTEKMTAGMTAGAQLLSGASPTRVLKGYRSKVRANMKRLSK